MQKKGFTLLELLVVIAIIGILATLALNINKGPHKKQKTSNQFVPVGEMIKAQ